jgi:hypothetical protein
MKSLKKTLVLLVVLSMILSAVSPVFAFSDVIAEEYAEQANKMAAFGVFAGDAEGNFNAEAEITRAEMAVIIGKLMGLTETEANANKVYASAFTDVAAGEWYTGWINLAAGRGIISGFPDSTFRPNEKVTQAQAVTMIVKALGWGVVVDQTGTWPANYITKAAELRLFKDAVATDSELVTRGNVAIYCYNALTAKTWDVTESTDGKLTSSSKNTDTILAKYFSDFVNEAGEMKLVEDAYVALSGANTAKIGANQIKLVATVENKAGNTVDVATFIDADKAPKRNKEVATYEDGSDVIAYVPAEVASIANLAGRKVDVIFGDDNVVAYIAVTDDSVENVYVTAWDTADDEIEIDGETYEFAPAATVAVFGHPLTTVTGTGSAATSDFAAVIDNLFKTAGTLANGRLDCLNSKDELVKNVVAEFILNGEDEIESINFKFSVDGYVATTTETTPTTLKINEFVVEKVSTKNALTVAGHSSENDLDDYEDIENLRVIKNGEIAEVADIEVGDVVTEVVLGTKAEIMIVTSNTVEGEVTDYLGKTNDLEIAGTNYKVVAVPFMNTEDDIEKLEASTASDVYDYFEEEGTEVTAYLNFAGEVVAVVGESEATGTILGIISTVSDEYDEENEVNYVKAKIFAEDGTNKYYRIYKNSKKNKDLSAENLGLVADTVANKVVMFEANADREIVAEDVRLITANASGLEFKSNSDVTVTKGVSSVSYDDKTINGKRFSSSTIVMNGYEKELMNGWQSLAIDDTTDSLADNSKEYMTVAEAEDVDVSTWTPVTNAAGTTVGYEKAKDTTDTYIFTKGQKVVYVVTWVDEFFYGASDEQYGILVDVDKDEDEDGERIYVATVLVNGKEEKYECEAAVRNYDEGTFISFKVSDGEFKVNPTQLIYKGIVDYIADATSDTAAMADIADYLTEAYRTNADITTYFKTISASTKFNAIKVESVEDVDGKAYVIFDDEVAGTSEATSVNLADNYVVYDLEAGEMADEINEGDYILVFDYDADDKGFEIVIVL